MSWAPEVITDNSGKWCGNGLRFATREEAERWVIDLSMRWTLVRDVRVVESDEPANSAIDATGAMSDIKEIANEEGFV